MWLQHRSELPRLSWKLESQWLELQCGCEGDQWCSLNLKADDSLALGRANVSAEG